MANYPGNYAYSPVASGKYALMDAGKRTEHIPKGIERGGTTFPYNANVRGIFKRYDPKQKPL